MKNTVCIFFSSLELEKIFLIYEELIKNLPNKYNKFYFVNFYKIQHKKKIYNLNHELYEKKYNIKIICPENQKEFNQFAENKFILAFDNLSKTFDCFKVRFLINKKNIRLVLFQNIGYFANQPTLEKDISLKNWFYIQKKIFTKKIFRVLVYIKLFSPIYLYFECRSDIVENCLKNEKKYLNRNNFFNYLYFENTIKINNRAYDKFTQNINNVSDDKIIFIDGNYKHLDILYRENIDLEKIKKEYFGKLSNFLNQIHKTINKEVIISLHPSSNLEEYKELLSDFKLSQYNTEKNIYSSYIVIFHESSSIDTAIFLKKRIISLKTDLFGKYFLNRIKKYNQTLDLLSIDLNQEFDFDKKFIEEKTQINEKKYDNYINNYLKSDENELGSIKVYKVLEQHFNLVNKNNDQ